MNLNKAIESLTALPLYMPLTPYTFDALQLGIKALWEVKRAREGDPALDGELLPGETEE